MYYGFHVLGYFVFSFRHEISLHFVTIALFFSSSRILKIQSFKTTVVFKEIKQIFNLAEMH